jgi:hypothetical protein
MDTDPNNCVFKRLGYLSFDSNERSNHQARELKSVHVNVQVRVHAYSSHGTGAALESSERMQARRAAGGIISCSHRGASALTRAFPFRPSSCGS